MAKGLHEPRYRDLIAKLADERKRLNLKQEDVAKRLGRHQQFVSRYEKGERRLDAVELIDVVRALGMDLAALLASVPAANSSQDSPASA